MAAVYSQSSPYYGSGLFSNQFLDVMAYRPITKLASDVEYVIDKFYEFRPDMLAYDLYGNAALWWVFAARNPNTLKDPLFDFAAGNTIYLPSKEQLKTDLGV